MSADGPRARRVLVGFLLFAASAAYFASYARIGLFDDEGYLLEGVTRILDGQVIYRDFHHTYAPGRFYMFAALFKIFGANLLVVRAAWVALRAGVVVLAWRVARRMIRGPLAWAPPLALLALPGPWHKSFFHFFLLAALLAGIALFESGGRARSFSAGAIVALAALFRQDVGIAAAGAIAVCVALRAAARRAPRAGEADTVGAPVSMPLLAAGFLVVLVPPLAYFSAERALGPMLAKVFLAGLRDNRANSLPFPPLLPLVPPGAPNAGAIAAILFVKVLYFAAPASFAAYAGFLAVGAARRRALPGARDLLLLLLGGSALLQVAARSDLPHLYQAIGLVYFPWALGAKALVDRLPARAASIAGAAAALAFPAALTAGLALVASTVGAQEGAAFLARSGVPIPIENASGARVSISRGPRVLLSTPRARLLVTPEEAAFVDGIGRFLEAHTKPGDYVLSVPGYQLMYFLFDRRNPTPFPHVRRAFDSPAEEDDYVASIEQHRTRYILYDDFAIDGRPERRFAVYAKKTMDWIVSHYQPIDHVGRTLALERIPGAS